MSHKPGGKLPLLSTRPAVTLATLKTAGTNFAAWWTMGVNSLLTRQRRDCDLNPGLSATESSTLTTRLPSHSRSEVYGAPNMNMNVLLGGRQGFTKLTYVSSGGLPTPAH